MDEHGDRREPISVIGFKNVGEQRVFFVGWLKPAAITTYIYNGYEWVKTGTGQQDRESDPFWKK
jgi:hypothetical protein